MDIQEKYASVSEAELTDIKKFLLINGFNQVTIPVIDSIAKLVAMSLADQELVIDDAYQKLAPEGVSKETIRSKLSYHMKRNYENVKNTILSKYDYNIGDYFIGIKAFIEQLAIVLYIFAQ